MSGVDARWRRSRLRAFAGGTLAAALVAGACGLDVIGAAPTSLDGSVGDGAVGAATDGAADASALPLLDAGSAEAAASPVPDFCVAEQAVAPYVYCNDFETGGVGFETRADAEGSATLEVVDVGTKALRVSLPDGSTSRSAYVRQSLGRLSELAESGYDVSFVFAVRQSSLDYAVLGGPFLATGVAASTGKAIGVAAYGAGALLDYAGSSAPPFLPTLPGETWHLARVRYGKSLLGAFSQVVIDGFTVDVALVDDAVALDLRLGAYATSADEGQLEVLFDDVLVRTF